MAKNSKSWAIEKQEWANYPTKTNTVTTVTAATNTANSDVNVNSDTEKKETHSTFYPWSVGGWKSKGFDIRERVAAEKQCMFKSLKVEKMRQVNKRNKKNKTIDKTGQTHSSITSGVELKEVGEKHDDDLIGQLITEGTEGKDVEVGGGVLMRQHVSKGLYVEQVDRWFDVFEGQRKKFLIVELESLKR